MRRVKKVKELTEQERKVRRAGKNAKLMKVDIPKRAFKGEIVKGMYYVIYEESFLKPQILKYSFRGQFYAKEYCKKHIPDKRYNVLEGSILLDLGFEKAYRSMRSVAKIRKAGAVNYNFPEELSPQRKKTLRTMYRRNYRRLMTKLINHGKG